MRVTDCTQQEAGETADVLDSMFDALDDEDFTPRELMLLDEIRDALRNAERGHA